MGNFTTFLYKKEKDVFEKRNFKIIVKLISLKKTKDENMNFYKIKSSLKKKKPKNHFVSYELRVHYTLKSLKVEVLSWFILKDISFDYIKKGISQIFRLIQAVVKSLY